MHKYNIVRYCVCVCVYLCLMAARITFATVVRTLLQSIQMYMYRFRLISVLFQSSILLLLISNVFYPVAGFLIYSFLAVQNINVANNNNIAGIPNANG